VRTCPGTASAGVSVRRAWASPTPDGPSPLGGLRPRLPDRRYGRYTVRVGRSRPLHDGPRPRTSAASGPAVRCSTAASWRPQAVRCRPGARHARRSGHQTPDPLHRRYWAIGAATTPASRHDPGRREEGSASQWASPARRALSGQPPGSAPFNGSEGGAGRRAHGPGRLCRARKVGDEVAGGAFRARVRS